MTTTFQEALTEHDHWLKQKKADAIRQIEKFYESLLSQNVPDFIKETVHKCKLIIEKMGREIDTFTTGGIYVDKGRWHLSIHYDAADSFSINFNVNIVPTDASRIALEVFQIAGDMEMHPEIGDDFTFVFDKNGDWKDTLFSECAYHYLDREIEYLDWDEEEE